MMGAIAAACVAAAPARVSIPAGEHRPFYLARGPDGGMPAAEKVPAFALDVRAVTAAEFAEFVRRNPTWRRSRVPRVFADPQYLASWGDDVTIAAGTAASPVTEVSWFAANAYCRWRGGRLPTVAQWERAAAEEGAAAAATDAQILSWYGRPAPAVLPAAAEATPNRWGVRGLHGVVWEWVLDFNDALVGGDGREGQPGEGALFCGSGAAGAADPGDYVGFMRNAFRSSLKASYTVKNLGFRCAR